METNEGWGNVAGRAVPSAWTPEGHIRTMWTWDVELRQNPTHPAFHFYNNGETEGISYPLNERRNTHLKRLGGLSKVAQQARCGSLYLET